MIRPRNGQTVTFTRTTKDLRGNPTGTPTVFTVDNCVFWWDQVTEDWQRRQTATVLGNLGIPRGSDVRHGDIATLANGQKFSTIGAPQWDQDSPLSGHQFGYMVCKLEAVT